MLRVYLQVSWDAHDGIKSALLGMLQAGLSGFSMSHSDIGGYTATPVRRRSEQLLMRWMELSALSDAVFRTHQGNQPHKNVQIWDSERLLKHMGHFARMHVVLSHFFRKKSALNDLAIDHSLHNT